MKLIQTTDYLLLIDEEAEIKGKPHLCYNSIKNTWNDDVILYQGAMPEYHYNGFQKIIAYRKLNEEAKELDLPELPSFENNMIVLLDKDIPSVFSGLIGREKEDYNKGYRESWIKGYKAAQSSNKQFSLEDMLDVFEFGLSKPEFQLTKKLKEDFTKFIQSLSTQQLPVSFEPEYEITYKEYKNGKKELISVEFHKITNSEGKEVLVGTYKY